MRVALVSCAELPSWEVDDTALVRALSETSVDMEVVRPAWSDPRFDWGEVDGALIRTTWDYADRLDEFLAWADTAAQRTRLVHGPEVLRWNLRKTYLLELERLGVPLAPTMWLEKGASVDLSCAMASMGWERGLIKPVVGASARGTMRFDAGCPFAQGHLEGMVGREAVMVQEYLPAVEREGELSAIVVQGQITHAVRKIPVAGDYRVQDDWGARDERVELAADLAALTVRTLEAAAEALAIEDPFVYARVDALRLEDGELVLNELEVVEPSLFFRHAPEAAERLACAFLRRIS